MDLFIPIMGRQIQSSILEFHAPYDLSKLSEKNYSYKKRLETVSSTFQNVDFVFF